MAKFNLDDYDTVESRIKKFYEDHPDGRIITNNLTTADDRSRGNWIVYSSIFFDWEELQRGTPKATGLAFETDGGFGPNQTSALENCETSSIGRALANAGYSGNLRASREEMEKVERGVRTPKVTDAQIAALKTKSEARALWVQANKAGASQDLLNKINEVAQSLAD